MKKTISVFLVLLVAVSCVFAVTVDGVLDTVNSVVKLAGVEITGWDGLIAIIIVVFVEFVVKTICTKCSISDNAWSVVVRLTPIGLSIVAYFVIALIQKSSIPTALIHGLGIGLTASGSYSSLVKLAKETFKKGVKTANSEAITILKGDNVSIDITENNDTETTDITVEEKEGDNNENA